MPFDSLNFEKPEAVRILSAAQDRIRDPKRWFQGRGTDTDSAGDRVCAMRALADQNNWFIANDYLNAAAGELFDCHSIAGQLKICDAAILNDFTDHTTVMRMFDRAIELAWERERV